MIIDYQSGKEKGFRSEAKNKRFDDSMELLGRLTKNTDAEDIFLAQIKKVNDARGLKPGDAGYKTPASYLQKISSDVKSIKDRPVISPAGPAFMYLTGIRTYLPLQPPRSKRL